MPIPSTVAGTTAAAPIPGIPPEVEVPSVVERVCPCWSVGHFFLSGTQAPDSHFSQRPQPHRGPQQLFSGGQMVAVALSQQLNDAGIQTEPQGRSERGQDSKVCQPS
jgi:hypothetical protein